MKSIIKVNYKVLSSHTRKQETIVENITVDGLHFNDTKMPPISINNGTAILPARTCYASSLADDYISNNLHINSKLIEAHNLFCILNWEILSIENYNADGSLLNKPMETLNKVKKIIAKKNKPKKITIKLMLKQFIDGIELQKDKNFIIESFVAVHSRIKDTIKKLPVEKQFEMIVSTMNVGLEAAGNAYKEMIERFNKPDQSNTISEVLPLIVAEQPLALDLPLTNQDIVIHPKQNIIATLKGKKILFLENDNALSNGIDILADLLTENNLKYTLLNKLRERDFKEIAKAILDHEVIIFQTQWVYDTSKTIEQFMYTIRSPKIVIEHYIHEPSWFYLPENTIHHLFIAETPDKLSMLYDDLDDGWKFYRLSSKPYWEYKNKFDN